MTCVAAVIHKTKVTLGADSACSSGWEISTIREPKVWTRGAFALGFSGEIRTLQLLKHAFEPPAIDPKRSLEDYLSTDFAAEMRRVLRHHGAAEVKNTTERGSLSMLVATKGRVFNFGGDYSYSESPLDYDAVGCGFPYAKGALHATRGQSPRRRLRIALKAAVEHSEGVRPPFHFVTI